MRHIALLIMSLVFGFVNTGQTLASEDKSPALIKKKLPKQIPPTEARQGLVQLLLDDGIDHNFGGLWSKHFDYPDPSPAYSADFGSSTTRDNLSHIGSLLVDKSDVTNAKPIKLVFTSIQESGSNVEEYKFIVSLNGTLEKAAISHAKAKVDGSAVFSVLDIDSPDVKKRLQHELDFWLYGKYHKDPKDWLKDLETYRLKAFAEKKPPATAKP